MPADSIARIRADFDALKARLAASIAELDPQRYDRIVHAIVNHDEETIRERIARRRASHRVAKMITEIEGRISRAETRSHD